MSARVISSSAANGSSISSSGAPSAIARTRATRCCIPPESSWGYALAKSARPTSPSSSSGSGSTRRRRAGSLPATAARSGRRCAKAAAPGDCGTNPTRLATRARCGLASSTVTRPALGSSSPPISRSSVVFPLPDAPRTVTISPGSTSRSIIRSASSPPKNLVTPRRRIEADTRPRVLAAPQELVTRAQLCRRTSSRACRRISSRSLRARFDAQRDAAGVRNPALWLAPRQADLRRRAGRRRGALGVEAALQASVRSTMSAVDSSSGSSSTTSFPASLALMRFSSST